MNTTKTNTPMGFPASDMDALTSYFALKFMVPYEHEKGGLLGRSSIPVSLYCTCALLSVGTSKGCQHYFMSFMRIVSILVL
jgi:hypothetical protein